MGRRTSNRRLTKALRKVLEAIIHEVRATGCPPPLAVIERRTGQGTYVRQAVVELTQLGYLHRPYTGRYVPVRSPSGEIFSLVLLTTPEEGEPRPLPPSTLEQRVDEQNERISNLERVFADLQSRSLEQ